MSRKTALACLVAVACLGCSTAAFAEEWHVCLVTASVNDGSNKMVHWAVSPPFEVSGIPDWQAQFELTKVERRAWAQQMGMTSPDGNFGCSEGLPDQASAQTRRADMRVTFGMYDDLGLKMGISYSWEDWHWTPSGSAAPPQEPAPVAETEPASAADDSAAESERQAQAEADARHAREQADREAAQQAERDRLAADKAKREREVAAKAERERIAAEEERRKRESASTDTDANRCVTSPSLRLHDTFQGNTAAYITNGCGTPVDVRICLMTDGKGWNCGMTFALQPQASWSWSSFNATGQVFMDARVQGSGKTLSSP